MKIGRYDMHMLVINYKQVNKGRTITCTLLMVFMISLKIAKRAAGKEKGRIKKVDAACARCKQR